MKAARLWLLPKSRPVNRMIVRVWVVWASTCKWLFDEENPFNTCCVLFLPLLSHTHTRKRTHTHKPQHSSQAEHVPHSCRQHSEPQVDSGTVLWRKSSKIKHSFVVKLWIPDKSSPSLKTASDVPESRNTEQNTNVCTLLQQTKDQQTSRPADHFAHTPSLC